MKYEQTYQDKVYEYIINMEGEIIIDKKVKPENRAEFLNHVKDFIRYDYGKAMQFDLQLSQDETKLRKHTRRPIKKL